MWFTKNNVGVKKDGWLMGDLFGGPPKPQNSVFTNKKKIVCDDCAEVIRKSLQSIRISNDINQIETAIINVKRCKCGCYSKYCSEMKKDEKTRRKYSLQKRGQKNIDFAYNSVNEYIKHMTPLELPIISCGNIVV